MPGQDLGQAFNGETLAGEMAGQEQTDAQGFSLQAGVEAGLAEDHCVATVLPGGIEQFARRAAGHRRRANTLLRIADQLQPLDLQELLQLRGKPPERERIGEPSAAAGTLALRVRQQRRDAAELQPGGQSLVDPLAGRVEGRMGVKTATWAAIRSKSSRPTIVSAVSRLVAANGIG